MHRWGGASGASVPAGARALVIFVAQYGPASLCFGRFGPVASDSDVSASRTRKERARRARSARHLPYLATTPIVRIWQMHAPNGGAFAIFGASTPDLLACHRIAPLLRDVQGFISAGTLNLPQMAPLDGKCAK